jgi:hypothetical protein
MLFISILHHYLLWHYGSAFKEILHVWKNLIWFTFHFFSIPQLLRSFFQPWKRMTEGRGRTFNFEDLAGFVIINLISRILGIMIRTSIITLGVITLGLLIIGIILTYIFWLLAPLLLVLNLYYGLVLMFA